MGLLRGLQHAAVVTATAASVFYGVASVSGPRPSLSEEWSGNPIKEILVLTAEKSAQVEQAAVSLLGIFKDTAVEVFKGSSAAGNMSQSLVSRAEIWSSQPTKSRTLVVMGGQIMLEWLLRKAASSPSPDQIASETAICNLLANDAAAAVLLGIEGAVPRLLGLLSHSEDPERLSAALSKAISSTSMPPNASLDDLRAVIAAIHEPRESLVRGAAAQILCQWAESSVLVCGKMATMQAGRALSEALAGRSSSIEDPFYIHITHAMAVLARDCPLRSLLGTEEWLPQLLFLAADAAAAGDDKLVVRALDTFSICLIALDGSHVADIAKLNAWTLLSTLAKKPGADLRRAITLAVASLSKYDIREDQRQHWAELLLAWLCAGEGVEEGYESKLHIALALDALSESPGRRGSRIASAWLGDMLVALSRNVKTYSSVRVGGRDMIEEVTQDYVPVVPVFARSVAHDLRNAYDMSSALQDPPIDMEQTIRPSLMLSLPDMMLPDDAAAADIQLCRALKEHCSSSSVAENNPQMQILCSLVSSDDSKQRWLQSAGIMKLLKRLVLRKTMDLIPSAAGIDTTVSLETQRECARLLAMLAASGDFQAIARDDQWIAWLQRAVPSEDSMLSSHAARALLHLESRGGLEASPSTCQGSEVASSENQGDIDLPVMREQTAGSEVLDENLGLERPSGGKVMFKDGVHLFCPQAEHHSILARDAAATSSAGAPLVDVVFVHGIRGGPFESWRAGLTAPRIPCWPSDWLSKDVPEARLLSLEYNAPASGWEGQSLPVRGTVGQLMDKLAAAGVGQRPCIFVCHSMGGILTKEIIAKALAKAAPDHQRNLADTTAGIVFYACPHQGSWLADIGWTLRFVGASPAASVLHLRPGKHLEEVDAAIKQLHTGKGMQVLNFCEGAPTTVMMSLPQLIVVPETSAYPGYGDFVFLEGVNHINACKPSSRSSPSYVRTRDFIAGIVAANKAES